MVAETSQAPPPHDGASGLASTTVASWVVGIVKLDPTAASAGASNVAVNGASVSVAVPETPAAQLTGLGVTVTV